MAAGGMPFIAPGGRFDTQTVSYGSLIVHSGGRVGPHIYPTARSDWAEGYYHVRTAIDQNNYEIRLNRLGDIPNTNIDGPPGYLSRHSKHGDGKGGGSGGGGASGTAGGGAGYSTRSKGSGLPQSYSGSSKIYTASQKDVLPYGYYAYADTRPQSLLNFRSATIASQIHAAFRSEPIITEISTDFGVGNILSAGISVEKITEHQVLDPAMHRNDRNNFEFVSFLRGISAISDQTVGKLLRIGGVQMQELRGISSIFDNLINKLAFIQQKHNGIMQAAGGTGTSEGSGGIGPLASGGGGSGDSTNNGNNSAANGGNRGGSGGNAADDGNNGNDGLAAAADGSADNVSEYPRTYEVVMTVADYQHAADQLGDAIHNAAMRRVLLGHAETARSFLHEFNIPEYWSHGQETNDDMRQIMSILDNQIVLRAAGHLDQLHAAQFSFLLVADRLLHRQRYRYNTQPFYEDPSLIVKDEIIDEEFEEKIAQLKLMKQQAKAERDEKRQRLQLFICRDAKTAMPQPDPYARDRPYLSGIDLICVNYDWGGNRLIARNAEDPHGPHYQILLNEWSTNAFDNDWRDICRSREDVILSTMFSAATADTYADIFGQVGSDRTLNVIDVQHKYANNFYFVLSKTSATGANWRLIPQVNPASISNQDRDDLECYLVYNAGTSFVAWQTWDDRYLLAICYYPADRRLILEPRYNQANNVNYRYELLLPETDVLVQSFDQMSTINTMIICQDPARYDANAVKSENTPILRAAEIALPQSNMQRLILRLDGRDIYDLPLYLHCAAGVDINDWINYMRIDLHVLRKERRHRGLLPLPPAAHRFTMQDVVHAIAIAETPQQKQLQQQSYLYRAASLPSLFQSEYGQQFLPTPNFTGRKFTNYLPSRLQLVNAAGVAAAGPVVGAQIQDEDPNLPGSSGQASFTSPRKRRATPRNEKDENEDEEVMNTFEEEDIEAKREKMK